MGAARPETKTSAAEDRWDQLDVPATVVCARCGDPGCASCALEPVTRSGVVNIVPWERPGGTLLGRLWSTARATTKDVESFFGALPDGPIAPALAFALLAEILAAFSWMLLAGVVVAAVFPGWCRGVALDPCARGLLVRALVAALPGFALMLVLGHAAHGVSLDRGARKTGASSSRRRALRYGLYATGWDLVIGPLGACVLALKEGLLAAAVVLQCGAGLPTRSARAFLRGVYRLDAPRTQVALRSSYVAAIVATLLAAFVILAAIVTAALAFPPRLFSL
jgi:hypothetical protein